MISSRFQANCNNRVHQTTSHATTSHKVQGANAAKPRWLPRQRVLHSEPQPQVQRRHATLHCSES